jgi:hypothetical protein
LTPELRARYLSPPWPSVRTGLERARHAAYVVSALYVFFLLAVLVLEAADRPALPQALIVLALAQMFPIVLHTVGQIVCTAAPSGHGGELAVTSVWLLGLAALALLGLLVPGAEYLAALGGCGMGFLSFQIWLRFLGRLGEGLDDGELAEAAWAFGRRLWLGFVVGLLLLGGSALTDAPRAGGSCFDWLLRVFAAAIALRLFVGYAALLQAASLAVARRGPVRHKP